MKHTQGKWTAKPDPSPFLEDDFIIGVEGGAPDAVATCSAHNAAVIRAAPEMLDALIAAERLFLHTWAMDGTVHKKMKAAIASATAALNKASPNLHPIARSPTMADRMTTTPVTNDVSVEGGVDLRAVIGRSIANDCWFVKVYPFADETTALAAKADIRAMIAARPAITAGTEAGAVERMAKAIHETCSKQDVMGYLNAKLDCTAIAQAAIAAITSETAEAAPVAKTYVREYSR